MQDLKIKQLQYESDAWKRWLAFLKDENVHLKNRLSEILRNNFDYELLTEVENFQNRFINEDEWVDLLRNDVGELDKLIQREIFEDGNIFKTIESRVKKIKRNIESTEKQFILLKQEFNNYLSENILKVYES